MGLLDLPAPLFAWLDGALGHFMPATARLVVWGIAAAILSMALYKTLSSQERITATKRKAAEARRALDAYDGEFAGAWPLIRETLRLALRQIGLVIGPAVAASVPVLCLIIWLSTAYGHSFPAPGSEPDIRTVPQQLQARWVDEGDPSQESAAPSQPPHVVVADAAGRIIGDFALSAPVSTLHKRVWWNALLGNPAGYLPDASTLDRIEIDLPRREYVPFGPSWLRGWETLFFTVLIAGSVAMKIGFRIE
jgi:hypothetical protein